MLITNAFSINMLKENGEVRFTKVSLDDAKQLAAGVESAVGHADTARVFTGLLGREVECNRKTVVLGEVHHTLLVGQYTGPRLPEGATELPAGATITWWHVILLSDDVPPKGWDAVEA